MKRLKKYTLVNPSRDIDFLFPDEIVEIIPGKNEIFISYYDDEFCIVSSVSCDKIIVEDFH